MWYHKLPKPIKRSNLRLRLGREYYILKRKFNWWFDRKKYVSKRTSHAANHPVFNHRSLILRPLKDVDMYLQENKRTNLKLAIQHVNGIVIRPGECFSLWKLIGRPTKGKGYLEGMVLKSGAIARDTGGGLCQLGNLLFWIFAHSSLTVTERHRHGFDVFPDVKRKVPFGAGATLAYNYIDLQVTNYTSDDYVIQLWMDDTHLNGELTCSRAQNEVVHLEERHHKIEQQYWGGYTRHNQIVKVTTSDKGVKEELLVENHAIMMYNPFLEK